LAARGERASDLMEREHPCARVHSLLGQAYGPERAELFSGEVTPRIDGRVRATELVLEEGLGEMNTRQPRIGCARSEASLAEVRETFLGGSSLDETRDESDGERQSGACSLHMRMERERTENGATNAHRVRYLGRGALGQSDRARQKSFFRGSRKGEEAHALPDDSSGITRCAGRGEGECEDARIPRSFERRDTLCREGASGRGLLAGQRMELGATDCSFDA
jgi:hypothetical protein